MLVSGLWHKCGGVGMLVSEFWHKCGGAGMLVSKLWHKCQALEEKHVERSEWLWC